MDVETARKGRGGKLCLLPSCFGREQAGFVLRGCLSLPELGDGGCTVHWARSRAWYQVLAFFSLVNGGMFETEMCLFVGSSLLRETCLF